MRTCILAIFWPKTQIIDFFKNNSCTNRDLASVKNYESEKLPRAHIIDRVFEALHSRDDGGIGQFRAMLLSLIQWSNFDPYYFETLKKLDKLEAQRQINHLKQLQEIRDAKIHEERRRYEAARTSNQTGPTLAQLNNQFINLYKDKIFNSQQRGYQFEKLLNDLSRLEKINSSDSFKIMGEQIDGALKYDGEHYLIEAKWQDTLSANDALYQFAYKVEGKMYGRGFFISVNGFSRDAVTMLIQGKSIKTILIDGGDLSAVFEGRLLFTEMLDVKIRAAQTKGLIYIDPLTQMSKI
ncbi:hypothetical protein D3C81_1269000 [compost metagenome]